VVAGVLVLVLAGGAFWVRGQIDPGSPGDKVAFTIPEGSTTTQVANLLEEAGIITNSAVFRYYVRYKGAGPFQAGEYDGLRIDSAMGDVITRLDQGPLPPVFMSLTIPPGLRLEEVKARLLESVPGIDAAELDAALAQARSVYLPDGVTNLEGFLYPETYQLEEDEATDEVALVNRLTAEFDRVAGELNYDEPNPMGLSAYELVVLASLIEEETKVDAERPKVAQVIYNRLRQGIPLGIDATSRYEAILAGRDREALDFESDSPYNTRRVAGLPPTPIASPGRASIEAALNPADGPWIYYVLEDAQGNHFFTDSNSEFLAAKERCRVAGLGCG
jgi:UPF0755 protein